LLNLGIVLLGAVLCGTGFLESNDVDGGTDRSTVLSKNLRILIVSYGFVVAFVGLTSLGISSFGREILDRHRVVLHLVQALTFFTLGNLILLPVEPNKPEIACVLIAEGFIITIYFANLKVERECENKSLSPGSANLYGSFADDGFDESQMYRYVQVDKHRFSGGRVNWNRKNIETRQKAIPEEDLDNSLALHDGGANMVIEEMKRDEQNIRSKYTDLLTKYESK